MDRVKEAAALRPDKNIGILLDTKGPEIRTGFFSEKCKGKIHLKAGATVELTTDYTFKGDETKFACTYDKLPTSVKPGSLILIADGSLVLRVKECLKSSVKCTIENDQSIGERKNMNLPNVKVDLPVLQPKDIDDLQNFGVKRGVDFVAASFVQSAADIAFIRQILGPEGKDIKIIAKIENQEGLDKFDEILAGTDGVMLSGETANGSFPKGAVEIMASTCREAEQLMRDEDSSGYDQIFKLMKEAKKNKVCLSAVEAVVSSAVKTACDIGAKAIVVLTETGETARLLAKFHPEAAIIAVSDNKHICQMIEGYMCNAFSVHSTEPRGNGNHARAAFDAGKKAGVMANGDTVVVVHTIRNEAGVKEWTTRLLTVSSSKTAYTNILPISAFEASTKRGDRMTGSPEAMRG